MNRVVLAVAGVLVVFGAILIYDSAVLFILKGAVGSRNYFGFDFKEFVIGMILSAAGGFALWYQLGNAANRLSLPIGLLFIGLFGSLLIGVEINSPLWFTSHEEVTVIGGAARIGEKREVRTRYVRRTEQRAPSMAAVIPEPVPEPPVRSLRTEPAVTRADATAALPAESSPSLPKPTPEKRSPAEDRAEPRPGRNPVPLGELVTGEYDVGPGCGDAKTISVESMALLEQATGTNEAAQYAANAEELLEQAIDADPRNVLAYDRLGLVHLMSRNDPQAAIDVYEESLLQFPNCGYVYFQLGGAYSANKEYAATKQAIARAIQLTPDPPASYYYNLGNAYLNGGDANGSVRRYLRALELDPNHSKARNNLTRARIELHDVEALLAMYPSDADSLRRIGVTMARQGQEASAIRFFEASLALEEDADTYYNAALNHGRLGQETEARAAASRALELVPGHSGALDILRVLNQ